MSRVLSNYSAGKDNNLNLIRFVAASLVLVSHSFALTGLPEPLWENFGITLGTLAVYVFFAMSGFLIAGSFLTRNSIVAFAWARALRIYPALLVSLALCVFGIGMYFTELQSLEYLSNSQTYRYLLRNSILFLGVDHSLPGVFGENTYKGAINGSLWTLPHEVRMYALMAGVGTAMLFVKRKTSENIFRVGFVTLVILGLVSNILVQVFRIEYTPPINLKLFTLFFSGAAFYVCQDRVLLSIWWFLLFCVLLLLCSFNKVMLLYALLIALPYLVFYIAYVPGGVVRNFNRVGDYSYGMYVYAFPVQQSIIALNPGISVVMLTLYAFVLTLALSILSWYLVENPALRYKGKYVLVKPLAYRLINWMPEKVRA